MLLVDDDEGVRALTRHVLVGCGYTVIEAASAEQALQIVTAQPESIHLVLTDVVMPDLGGRELTSRLQTTHPGVKALFMSGYTDDAIVRHGVLYDEVQFLQKPFTPIALANKVREVLDLR